MNTRPKPGRTSGPPTPEKRCSAVLPCQCRAVGTELSQCTRLSLLESKASSFGESTTHWPNTIWRAPNAVSSMRTTRHHVPGASSLTPTSAWDIPERRTMQCIRQEAGFLCPKSFLVCGRTGSQDGSPPLFSKSCRFAGVFASGRRKRKVARNLDHFVSSMKCRSLCTTDGLICRW